MISPTHPLRFGNLAKFAQFETFVQQDAATQREQRVAGQAERYLDDLKKQEIVTNPKFELTGLDVFRVLKQLQDQIATTRTSLFKAFDDWQEQGQSPARLSLSPQLKATFEWLVSNDIIYKTYSDQPFTEVGLKMVELDAKQQQAEAEKK